MINYLHGSYNRNGGALQPLSQSVAAAFGERTQTMPGVQVALVEPAAQEQLERGE